MAESQNTEYKSSWRDEYIKWICGFANGNGGTLYIGVDDTGKVIGLDDSKKLLEDIPNKIRDILGIIVDVDVLKKGKLAYLKIEVDKYPYPISYKGQYHIRSGSTKQELKGVALDKFLLERKGKKWDGVPVPKIKVADLKKETLEFYKNKAALSERGTSSVLTDSNAILLDNLNLVEGNYLKRAAILMFHPQPQKLLAGCYIKIGYFQTDDELLYQDEVSGNLFEQVEKTIDLLYSKYIKSKIRYEKLNRIESYDYPFAAIREALLNAIIHKDYSNNNPIQISVYEDHFIIWNEGQLPDDWTVANLSVKHPSKPFNPDIANAFFRSGYIESWGRGTISMIKECQKNNLPKPEFKYDMSGFFVTFRKYKYDIAALENIGLNNRQAECIMHMLRNHSDMSNVLYQEKFNVSKRTATSDLKELVETYDLLTKSNTKGPGVVYRVK